MQRCEIIAEIGINHQGDMLIAKKLSESAKICGADVVKFQLYDPKKLLHPTDFSPEDWACILDAQLTYDQTFELKCHCDDVGIEFMASAFDEKRLNWLESMNVERHKIASRSIADEDYLRLFEDINKPILVSNGLVTSGKIATGDFWRVMARDLHYDEKDIHVLYCVSEYPTPLDRLNFRHNPFSMDFGFSDHTVGVTAAKVAMVLGAKIVEKHFTYDKKVPGPDHVCSIDAKELKMLCQFRDDLTKMDL